MGTKKNQLVCEHCGAKRPRANPFGHELLQVYQRYPRKLGKTIGLTKLGIQIQTHGDLLSVNQALDNFVQYHKEQATEAQFVPHFSTWVSTWKDWLDPQSGNAEGFDNKQTLKDLDLGGEW